MHFEQHTELDNLIAMQNLRTSANKGSNDAYDVSVSLTSYEPNYMAFSELNDSQGSFSYITPSSDQDIDDVTLGKLLTEAHRGEADYCDPEGVSVSQSSLSVVFDGTGKPAGERDVDQSIGFGVTRNTHSAHSSLCVCSRGISIAWFPHGFVLTCDFKQDLSSVSCSVTRPAVDAAMVLAPIARARRRAM